MVWKAAKQLGLISSYRHAFGVEHALEALVLRPVITGIRWYTSFDTPDSNGLVEIASGATVRGGHEIVADEIDAGKQARLVLEQLGNEVRAGWALLHELGYLEHLARRTGRRHRAA